jgi:hypothetical protein
MDSNPKMIPLNYIYPERRCTVDACAFFILTAPDFLRPDTSSGTGEKFFDKPLIIQGIIFVFLFLI